MVVAFTVDPRQSSAPKYSSLLRQYGVLAYHCTDLSGWADDFRAYVVYMQSVIVDPFHPSIVGSSGESGECAVDDHLFGRGCKMSKKEWRRFCFEVLLLDAAIPQSMDAIVGMVDDMLRTIIRCVAGCDEFSVACTGRLMVLVMALVRFLLLCGGGGVFPREYAFARFGAFESFMRTCKGEVDESVRMFAQKAMRRLNSLGRCVRGLIRVAWEHSMWDDPELASRLGLEAGKGYNLRDVWRAAVGTECGLAVLMRSVIGPGYNVYSAIDASVGYEDHEYDVTTWGSGTVHAPMSSDTQTSYALAVLVSTSGRLASFGGVDRQVKIFLHNVLMGFCHERRYRGLGADSPVVVDILDVMGMSFGVGLDGKGSPGQFRVSGGRSWFVGGRDGLRVFGDEEDESISSFMEALDGTRPVVRDEDAEFRKSVMDSAREVVTNFARHRGYNDSVMDLIASVSYEDFSGLSGHCCEGSRTRC